MTTFDVVVRRSRGGEELCRTTHATRAEAEAYRDRTARITRDFAVAVEETEHETRGVRTASGPVH